ncbi:MAG: hypothetical protein VX346_15455 [Planctomycetota bacterium]|nr:hypothetical protein [Planctomycetota bacterium]
MADAHGSLVADFGLGRQPVFLRICWLKKLRAVLEKTLMVARSVPQAASRLSVKLVENFDPWLTMKIASLGVDVAPRRPLHNDLRCAVREHPRPHTHWRATAGQTGRHALCAKRSEKGPR